MNRTDRKNSEQLEMSFIEIDRFSVNIILYRGTHQGLDFRDNCADFLSSSLNSRFPATVNFFFFCQIIKTHYITAKNAYLI